MRAAARQRGDFNPLAPCGARRQHPGVLVAVEHFNPLAPCGARPGSLTLQEAAEENFNPLAPCGARPWHCARCGSRTGISIHSPRVERDMTAGPRATRLRISIHSPRVERDQDWSESSYLCQIFQSTRPVWSET